MPGSDFLHLDPSTAPARGRTNWLVDRLRRAMADGTLSAHRFTPGPPGLVIGYGPHSAPLLERAIRTLGVLAGIRRD